MVAHFVYWSFWQSKDYTRSLYGNESVMVKYMVVFAEQVSHESALVQIRFLLVCVSTVTEDNFTVEKFCGSRLLDMQIFNSQKSICP